MRWKFKDSLVLARCCALLCLPCCVTSSMAQRPLDQWDKIMAEEDECDKEEEEVRATPCELRFLPLLPTLPLLAGVVIHLF